MSATGEDRVAITAVGVLTPLADTLDGLAHALADGRSAIATLGQPTPHAVSRFVDFDATRYANVRGMRIYNRTTRLGICATRLALDGAGLEAGTTAGALAPEQLGVVMASSYGHLDTLIEYDRSLLTNGLARTNPALMPLAIPSAPGAIIALSFGAKACSLTLAHGGASSLDALGLAARLLRAGRVTACLVVSAFSVFDDLVLSLVRAGRLAEADHVRVFDRDSRGCALGEAGVALVLEREADARARGRNPLALVSGHAATFAPPARLADTLGRACRGALAQAGQAAGELALVASGAGGVPADDAAEASALRATLGDARVPITAVKSALGETVDVSGLLAVASAVAVLAGAPLPPVRGLASPAEPGLRYVTQAAPAHGDGALITATGQTGAAAAVVLSRGGHARA